MRTVTVEVPEGHMVKIVKEESMQPTQKVMQRAYTIPVSLKRLLLSVSAQPKTFKISLLSPSQSLTILFPVYYKGLNFYMSSVFPLKKWGE